MIRRRDFIKQGSILSGTLLIAPGLLHAAENNSFKQSRYKYGLQLYTVRDAMGKDPAGTLARVAEIGYEEVEAATYTGTEKFYNQSGNDFAKLLKANGLAMPSGHYLLGNPQQKGTVHADWQRAVDDAAAIGMKYMVLAFLNANERKTIDDYKKVVEDMNKAGEVCKKRGIQFCYHNHDFEFKNIDGQLPYDLILKGADKDLVKMEMDVYWVTHAGFDPVKLINEHPGRFVLWHVKDMDNTPKKFFTEVGNGVIDWKRIFAHAKEAGLKHYFVEQDVSKSPFDSIRESIGYLKKNKFIN